MHAVFQVRVRKPVDFVRTALQHFSSECFLSLEGDLSRIDTMAITGAAHAATTLLRRNTTWPEQQFVIFPVTADTTDVICKRVLPQVGLKHHVLHVQVASCGRLVLGAFDKFHNDCVWIDQSIGREGITSMLDSGIIGWYKAREYEERTA
jgi:hypothetical protein